MGENRLKKNISSESVSAVFIIVLVSLFILSNFVSGFNFPLYILAMALSFFIALFYPRSGIYAIVFLTVIFERFFTLQTLILGKGEYKLYPIDIILAGVFIGAVFELLSQKISAGSDGLNIVEQNGQKKLQTFELKKPDFYLIGFMFFVAIYFIVSSFVLKNDFALAFSSFKNYVFYSLFYFLTFFLMNKKEYVVRLFKFLFSSAVFVILFIVFGLATRHGVWSEFTPLSTEGVRTLAFTHAFYLGLAFLGVFTYQIFQKNKERSRLYFTLMLIWSLGIVGSMMRHLWGGLVVSAFALYFLVAEKQRKIFEKIFIKYSIMLLLAVFVALYLSAVFPYSSFSNTASSTQKVIETRVGSVFSASTDESFSWRSMVWTQGLAKYMKSPILGLGLGKRIYVESEGYSDLVEVRNIHNSLLVLLFQFGLIPLFFFIMFIWENLKNIYRKTDKSWIDMALIASLVYFLVSFLFQPYLETNMLGIFFWIILGLIAARTRNNSRSECVEKSLRNPSIPSTRDSG